MGQLTDRLRDLGETPEAVAEKLLELGFKGHPGCSKTCPVVLAHMDIPSN